MPTSQKFGVNNLRLLSINNQKGLAPMAIVIGIVVIAVIGVAVLMMAPKQPTPVENAQPTSGPESTEVPSATTRNGIQPRQATSAASNCDSATRVCFDSLNIKVRLQEGYLEEQDKWIAPAILLIGNGKVCYTLNLSRDFPATFSIPKNQDCFGTSTQTVNIRAQKNVAKLGTYKGFVTLKSNNVSQIANLEVEYVAWDKSAIHTDPDKLVINAKEIKSTDTNQTWTAVEPFKFYYMGSHTVDIKTVLQKGEPDGITAKFNSGSGPDYIDMRDTVLVGISYTKNQSQFKAGQYTGYFQFLDHMTKEELYRMPYELNVSAN